MNKKSLVLVCLTIFIFASALIFLPTNIASHLNGLGESTTFSNKYIVFLLFSIVDVVGSIFWNKIIEFSQNFKFINNLKLKDGIKTYFSFLMMLLLFSILFATFSTLPSVWLLIGGHVIYIIYLLVVTTHNP